MAPVLGHAPPEEQLIEGKDLRLSCIVVLGSKFPLYIFIIKDEIVSTHASDPMVQGWEADRYWRIGYCKFYLDEKWHLGESLSPTRIGYMEYFFLSLKANLAFFLQIEGGGSSLLLRNGNPKDEGRYTCAAISPAGNATIHINVQLISKSVCLFLQWACPSLPLPCPIVSRSLVHGQISRFRKTRIRRVDRPGHWEAE